MGNITFIVIFAVLDVSLAVNLCINCSFLIHFFSKEEAIEAPQASKDGVRWRKLGPLQRIKSFFVPIMISLGAF